MVFGKSFLLVFFTLTKKFVNNLEIADIILRYCHFEWCNETKNKIKAVNGVNSSSSFFSQNENNNNDFDNISIFDDRFKLFIKEQLEKHIDICVKIDLINTVHKIGEIKEAISKSRTLLKIKKTSSCIKMY